MTSNFVRRDVNAHAKWSYLRVAYFLVSRSASLVTAISAALSPWAWFSNRGFESRREEVNHADIDFLVPSSELDCRSIQCAIHRGPSLVTFHLRVGRLIQADVGMAATVGFMDAANAVAVEWGIGTKTPGVLDEASDDGDRICVGI